MAIFNSYVCLPEGNNGIFNGIPSGVIKYGHWKIQALAMDVVIARIYKPNGRTLIIYDWRIMENR
jgi:hypothetical protein